MSRNYLYRLLNIINIFHMYSYALIPFFFSISLALSIFLQSSDFIWAFLAPYMGVIPNPKMAFIFPISCILAHIFPIFMKYFLKSSGKGSFPKSEIKSPLPFPFSASAGRVLAFSLLVIRLGFFLFYC